MNELLNGLYVVDLEALDCIATDGFSVLPLRNLVRVEFGAYDYESAIFSDLDEPVDSATFKTIQEDSMGLYFYPLDKIQLARDEGEHLAKNSGVSTYAIVEARFPGDDIHFPSVPTRDQLFVYEDRVSDIEIAGMRLYEQLGSGAMVTQLFYPVSEHN